MNDLFFVEGVFAVFFSENGLFIVNWKVVLLYHPILFLNYSQSCILCTAVGPISAAASLGTSLGVAPAYVLLPSSGFLQVCLLCVRVVTGVAATNKAFKLDLIAGK